MRIWLSMKGIATIGAALMGLSACTLTSDEVVQDPSQTANQTTDMPYHPLVYHLDLSIFAYQLYGQSLVWPHDPYYEELAANGAERNTMIRKVQDWTQAQSAVQKTKSRGLKGYRGPGVLNGFVDNPTHDPIIYDYSLVHPWSNTITNAAGLWTEYLTPKKITRRIKDGYFCYRPYGKPESASSVASIKRDHADVDKNAHDVLLAFEGGTGDKGEPDQPHSQSLMGFVLLRQKTNGRYDAHIAFRGSRSGSAGRAVKQAFSDENAKGNPDWITDLGYNRLSSGEGGALVSKRGQVHRGFAQSIKSTLPQIRRCLEKAADIKNGKPPENIFVTGHSLGGALAQQFTAAVLLGDRYGPDGTGPAMPSRLKNWPWRNIKLLTYGAPRVGDIEFAEALTVEKLKSEQFATAFNPVDPDALKVTDISILPRLSNPQMPAGFRVLNSKDPITTEKVVGGKHVGKTVYVNKPNLLDAVSPPDFNAHEQRQIRDYMIESLKDPRIPELAIRYVAMTEINPARNKKKKGSPAELQKLADATNSYYQNNQVWFDGARFDANVAVRAGIAAK
jgi:Lipase (class 3)